MTNSGKAERNPLWWYLFLFTFVLTVLGSTRLGAAQLSASVVKIDITPDKPQWLLGYGPRQSTGVHDRLYHRIVAMDDGTTLFFLISTDICLYSPSVYDDVTKGIEKQTGMRPLQIWWTVTHIMRHRRSELPGWAPSSWASATSTTTTRSIPPGWRTS